MTNQAQGRDTSRRTEPLDQTEIDEFDKNGFLLPIRVLDDEAVAKLREAMEEHLAGGTGTDTFELLGSKECARWGDQHSGSLLYDQAKVQLRRVSRTRFPFSSIFGEKDERFSQVVGTR